MNGCTRLLSHNTLPDLEEAVVPPDEKEQQQQQNEQFHQRAIRGCKRHSIVWIPLVSLVCVLALGMRVGGMGLLNNNNNNNVNKAATPSPEPEMNSQPSYVETRNVEFPTDLDSVHQHSDHDGVIPDDAYAISFSSKKTHPSSTSAADAKNNKKAKYPVPSASSYSLDNPFTGLPAGAACMNHFDCANHACGKETWTNGAAMICCPGGFSLWTTLPDWTMGTVCGNQAVGAPCNEDNVCAVGNCSNGKCQATPKS